MHLGRIEALRLLHRTFSTLPAGSRVHLLVRYLTCPFLRALPLVPPEASILDVGAGHGLFATLAVGAGAKRVICVDPDLRKVFSTRHDPPIRFVAGFADAMRGRFDVVTLFDVFYRIPLHERDALLATLYERVEPGGLIMIKDLDPSHRMKAAWNRLQEWISDRFLGLTLGDAFAYEAREDLGRRLEKAGFEDVAFHDIGLFHPHAHLAIVGRKPWNSTGPTGL